jgi:hypothetical protein
MTVVWGGRRRYTPGQEATTIMRKLGAIVVLGVMLIAASPLPAHAFVVETVLALGAFAVLSPFFVVGALLGAPFYAPAYMAPPPAVYSAPAPVVYSQPAPVYATRPVTYASPPAGPPPPPRVQREVVYPHGRYELYGDGRSMPYQWVWVANTTPPPPPEPPAPPTR